MSITCRWDVVILDYGGYPFIHQLAEHLSRKMRIIYVFMPCYGGPLSVSETSDMEIVNADGAFKIVKISADRLYTKSIYGRFFLEMGVGSDVTKFLADCRPQVVVSANMPLLAQRCVVSWCRRNSVCQIHWLQDLLGPAARSILARKIPIVGGLIGLFFDLLERRLLKKSNGVISISSAFEDHLDSIGVLKCNRLNLPNWAVLSRQHPHIKHNEWRHSIDPTLASFVVLYSGSLGEKHHPKLILEVARLCESDPSIRFVVMARGSGMKWLQNELRQSPQDNLSCRDYALLEKLPEILAGSDIFIATLESDAAQYSIPSKILTYLAAGRPIILACGTSSQAASIVLEADAGAVVSPNLPQEMCDVVKFYNKNRSIGEATGLRGQQYAEANFDICKIADKFINFVDLTRENAK